MAIGPWEVFIILVILVIVFGAGRISHVGGAFGRSIREFRSAVQEDPKATPITPVVVLPPISCPSCQVENSASNKFCSSCGATLTPPVAPDNTCPSCNTVNPHGQVFCGQCGTRLVRAA